MDGFWFCFVIVFVDGDGVDYGWVEIDGGDVLYGVEDYGKFVFFI